MNLFLVNGTQLHEDLGSARDGARGGLRRPPRNVQRAACSVLHAARCCPREARIVEAPAATSIEVHTNSGRYTLRGGARYAKRYQRIRIEAGDG